MTTFLTKSIKQKIKEYLKYNGRVPAATLQRQADNWHTTGDTIARRCREMAKDGEIIRTFSERHTSQYSLPFNDQGRLL